MLKVGGAEDKLLRPDYSQKICDFDSLKTKKWARITGANRRFLNEI